MYLIGGLTALDSNKLKNPDQFLPVSKIQKYDESSDTWKIIFELKELEKNSSILLTSNLIS